MGEVKYFIGDPPKVVGTVYLNTGGVQHALSLGLVVKGFSHLGKVLGVESRTGRPEAATSEGTSWGATTASAPWKGSESTP
jgi:hypothetical protein